MKYLKKYQKFFEDGDQKIVSAIEYSSQNTQQMNVAEVKEKLLSLEYVQKELVGWKA